MKNSVKISLAVVIWGLFYFLLLWRLPYCCQVKQIKLPDKCKDITIKVGWTDVNVSHITMGRMFKADTTDTDALWEEILKDNGKLWEVVQALPKHMSHLDIWNLGKTSLESWMYEEGISANAFYGRVDKENAEYYYVLKYNVDFGIFDAVMIVCGGILSMILVGFTAGFLLHGTFLKKKSKLRHLKY